MLTFLALATNPLEHVLPHELLRSPAMRPTQASPFTNQMIMATVAAGLMVWLFPKLFKHADASPPTGAKNFFESILEFLRVEVIRPALKENTDRFLPFLWTLFFYILYSNLLGLLPWGASPTGNLAVTGALAIVVFLTVEIAGFLKLGARGYLRTIFPVVPGLSGAGATVMSFAMAPIELLGKFVKPFALAVRLFGNMTAGHFVILSLFGIMFLFGNLGAWSYGIAGTTVLLLVGIMLLELFVAVLQAYVFGLLAAVFIGLMQHEH